MINVSFCPPKPMLLDGTTSSPGVARATFGT
jgi:hypothetical protein